VRRFFTRTPEPRPEVQQAVEAIKNGSWRTPEAQATMVELIGNDVVSLMNACDAIGMCLPVILELDEEALRAVKWVQARLAQEANQRVRDAGIDVPDPLFELITGSVIARGSGIESP
jgi:hypothetical protein